MKRRGFTLIELLVVIAIIALLAGLLLPALSAARRRAKVTHASSECKQVSMGWKSFYNDYREFPSGIQEMTTTAIDLLRGTSGTLNARQTVYMEFDSTKTASFSRFEDPWEETYKVELDDDYDNEITPRDYTTEQIYQTAVAWSYGPDKTVNAVGSNGDDDVRSWERR